MHPQIPNRARSETATVRVADLRRAQTSGTMRESERAGGCRTGRDTAGAIERAGFRVEYLDRLAYPQTRIPFPDSPQILGTATRP
jgi:hypothetical protein